MSDRRYLERKEGTYNSSSVKKKDIYNIVDILEEKLTPASTPEYDDQFHSSSQEDGSGPGLSFKEKLYLTRIAAAILELAAALFPVPDPRCTIWCWL